MIRFIVLLLLLAAVLYGIFWAIDRRNSGGSGSLARRTPRGPVGPDDDEAFLRNLDWEQRRRKNRPPSTNPADDPDPNPPHPPSSQESNDHPE